MESYENYADLELWTVNISNIKRLEAFGMCMYRWMLRIPCTDRVGNDRAMNRFNKHRDAGDDQGLADCIPGTHTTKSENWFAPTYIVGKSEGKHGMGRRRKSWLSNPLK